MQKQIYLLSDPITEIPMYIGATSTKITQRIASHFHNKNVSSQKIEWFKYLKDNNLYPHYVILEPFCDNWELLEETYIGLFKSWGFGLLNKSLSGSGGRHIRTDEENKHMSEKLKGRTFSDEHRRKLGEFNKIRIISKETRQKRSDRFKNKPQSEEFKRKRLQSLVTPVINIITQEIYFCAKDAATKNDINYATLVSWLKHPHRNKTDLRYLNK